MIRVAINGFGRIGRAAFKIIFERSDMEVVAINDPHDHESVPYLLKYDSVYGRYDRQVSLEDEVLRVDGKKITLCAERDPEMLPWKKLGVDIVIESTGVFTSMESAKPHVEMAGARGVVISAPPKDAVTPIYVEGVNESEMKNASIVSNASCTTNCVAPVMDVLQKAFGIKKAMMTTVHSYTNDQSLVDGIHKDLRRGRAAGLNMIPTTTGAAIAAAKTVPEIAGLFDGLSIRVPTPVVSISDITALLSSKVTIDDVNQAFIEASERLEYRGILGVTSDPVVSSDFIGSTYSAVVDLALTNVVDQDLVKVIAWYDNEWGYSCRLVDMVAHVYKTLLQT